MSVTASVQPAVVKVASGAVTFFCVLAFSALTGCFEKTPPAETAAQPPAQAQEHDAHQHDAHQHQEEAKPVVQEQPKPVKAKAAAPAPKPQKAAAPLCVDCGVIDAITAIEVKGEGSGAGAVAGALAGAVIGNQVSDDKKKRRLAQVVGVAGGAVAGHQIEKAIRKETQYEIKVRMEDGTQKTVTQKTSDGLSQGMKVRVVDGAVVARQ